MILTFQVDNVDSYAVRIPNIDKVLPKLIEAMKGKCPCKTCQVCDEGFFQFPECQGTKIWIPKMNWSDDFLKIECNCDPSGSKSIGCDNNGNCVCQVGFSGSKCSSCAIGFSGEICQVCNEGFFNYPECQGTNY